MNAQHTPLDETPCPLGAWASAYVAGSLSDAQSAELEEHLAVCSSCCAAVDALTEPSDEAVRLLAALPASDDDEPEFRRLEARLLSATPREAGSTRKLPRLADPPLGPLPQLLGNYELLECIGRGAWGAVYRARHTKLEQAVAVKVLDTSRLPSDHAVERFVQEMKAAGQLNHPNIVRASDAGEDRGFHYLVMEFVEGVDVSRLIQRVGPLAVADACEIVRQAASALDFAHQRSWVHRDVKPSNLMLTRDGVVKVFDLGVAGRSDEPHGARDQERTPMGTADYMAPEQWTDFARVDQRADVYSLGCTLFKLLTGRVPYERSGASTRPDTCPSIAAERTDVRRGLDQFVARMLARAPGERVATAAQVAAGLARWSRRADLRALAARALGVAPSLSELSAHAVLPAGGDRRRARLTRRRLLAGAAVTGAAALAAPWLFTPRPPRLRRSQWRALAPVAPAVWLSVEPTDEVSWDDDRPPRVRVRSRELALVQLGRAVSGVFAVRVALKQEVWQGGAGIFFQGRQVSADPLTHQFLTLEVCPKDESATRHLLWSRWEVVSDGRERAPTRQPLADTRVDLTQPGEWQQLQATIGRRGFPEVVWNERELFESDWTMSSEARRLAGLRADQVDRHYLGRLGLVNLRDATVFYRPELVYL